MKKRPNPLRRRLLRELKGDIGRYIVVFLIMILTVGFCSGFSIADKSIVYSAEQAYEKYNREDGNLQVKNKLNKSQIKDIESLGVELCNNFYDTIDFTNGSHIRVFANRTNMNTACVMRGSLPVNTDEIAVDRMWADNNDVSVGDTIATEAGKEYKVTGLIALPDYSALFEDNGDSMFDSKTFAVAVVCKKEFDSFDEELITYDYAWKYDHTPADDTEADEMSTDFKEGLKDLITLSEYLPAYQNQAISYVPEDLGSDGPMMKILSYFLIGIIAFVFAITSKHTIVKEAGVIGTLRASGYSRGELLGHYLTLPIVVTVISAILGNVLGYTWFKDLCADVYYGSYSLPTYVTQWSGQALIETTLVPLFLMILINFFVLYTNLKKPVLSFLRGDLSNQKNRRAMKLSHRIKIFKRFQIRVLLRNIPSYLLIFVGAFFCNIILLFGMALPNILDNYSKNLPDTMFANYIYMLDMPEEASYDNDFMELLGMASFSSDIVTENKDAEKFSAYSLMTYGDVPMEEDVVIYGVDDESKYVDINHYTDGVTISSAMSEKYGYKVGDTISLKEKYNEDTYEFTIKDIYDYNAGVVMFMDMDYLNEVFDLGEGTFVGYFSDSEITDIDEKYIGSVTDYDALNKISEQLDVTMGQMMTAVDVVAVLIFVLVVYLLAKIIIEKDAHSISIIKILGFNKGEIGRLYIGPMSIAVVFCFVVSIPLVYEFIMIIFKVMLAQMMAGWLPIAISKIVFVKMIALGIGTYAVVAVLEYLKVIKVPMDIALKTIE